MPPRRPEAHAQPPDPAPAQAPLTPDELAALRVVWAAEAVPLRPSAGGRRPLPYVHELHHRWTMSRRVAEGHDTRAPVTRDEVAQAQAAFARLPGLGYLRTVGDRYAGTLALSPQAHRLVARELPGWWAADGVLHAAAGVRALEEHTPGEVTATFARFLALADGTPLQASGRPGARAVRALLRFLPPSPMDASWTADPAAAGDAAWAQYPPRLAPYAALAAYLDLLQQAGGRWVVPDVELWLDQPPPEQWRQLVAAWSRAAAAPLTRLALAPHPGYWLAPERLVAWFARYSAGVGRLADFLLVAVAAAAVTLGVARLGAAGDLLVLQPTEAGLGALEGRPVEPWPCKDPTAVQGDFTLIEPLVDDPWTAWQLARLAELEQVDRVAALRLTRPAWTAARERGEDLREAVVFLAEACGGKLPQNVRFTLEQDWTGAGRTAELQAATLLRFAGEAAAAQARTLPEVRRGVAEELTPTVWRLLPGGEAAVTRALRKLGVACGPAGAGPGEAQGGGGGGGTAPGGAKSGSGSKSGTGTRAAGGAQAHPAPTAGDGGVTFRLPWPGPFGEAPAEGFVPVPLHREEAQLPPQPFSVVRMPPQALYRRLWLASKNGETVWIETAGEGIVAFSPDHVTRRTLGGRCHGCGSEHVLDLDEVRGMLDEEALAARGW